MFNFKLILFLVILLFISLETKSENLCFADAKVATSLLPPLVTNLNSIVSGEATSSLHRHFNSVLSYKVHLYPWARALESAKYGAVDALYPVLKSKMRERELFFIEKPLGEVTISLFKQINTVSVPLNQEAKVATLRGFEYDITTLNGAKVTEVNNFEHAMKMVSAGRVDYALGVKEVINIFLNANKITNVEFFKNIESRPVFIALSKASNNFKEIKLCLTDVH